MCWNKEVSLNTFIFSTFVLGFVVYNNAYTKYKIHVMNDPWMILFFFSFILMQLIEYFIWKNINNSFYNQLFSGLASILLILQPIVSLMLLRNESLRKTMLGVFLLLAIPYTIYQFATKRIYSDVNKNGYLVWNFFKTSPVLWVVWLFFFLFSFAYNRLWSFVAFGLITLAITFLNFKKNNGIGSMWCWLVNSSMIWAAFYIVIFLPYQEKGKIC